MRRMLFRWRARTHVRQERLARLRQNDATLLDRLYGTPYEEMTFPPARSVDEQEAVRAVRFVLRLGRELFTAGSSTRDIETAVVAVTAAWGLQDLEVDISGQCLQVQYAPPDRTPVVMLTALGTEDTRDLNRLTGLERLTARIVAGRIAPDDAARALDELVTSPAPWPWWFSLGGGTVLAAMLCVLASGTGRAAVAAAVVFLVGNRAAWAASRSGLPSFFVTALQTALIMAIVMALIDGGALSGPEGASVVAANVILMLPILTVVSLTEDAIDGFRSMAAARTVSLSMFFAALLSGVLVVSFLLSALDTDARNTTLTSLPVWLTLVTSGIGALGNAAFMGGGPRLIPWAVAVALIGAAVKMVGTAQFGWSAPLAIGVATLVMGSVAGAVAPRAGLPGRAVLTPGIAGGVLPGPDLYRSLLQLFLDIPGAGAYLGTTLASVAGIGVGAVLGTLVGSAGWRRRTRRHKSGGSGSPGPLPRPSSP